MNFSTLQTAEWLLSIAARTPRKVMWKAAGILGAIWYLSDAHRRHIADKNLELAFGDHMNNGARADLCRRTFLHAARVVSELPYLGKLNADNVDQFVVFKGFEHLRTAASGGKGALVVSSHLGNWEMMAIGVPLHFGKIFVVVRPLDNALLDRVVNEVRTHTGNCMIPKKGSALRIIRSLKQGGVVALLNDQNAVRDEGVFVPFFGELASTNKALAAIALRTGTPVLPAHNFRLPDGRYQIVVEPKIQLIQTGDMERDVKANTAIFNEIIEGHIRSHPEQWLWMHKRWRTRPKDRVHAKDPRSAGS